MCFKKVRRLLFAGSMAGLIIGVSQVFGAGVDDGKVNANENAVPTKRDPFWPVGYVPKSMKGDAGDEVEKEKGNTDWKEARKKIVVNGVSSCGDNKYVAVINNKIKSVGELVSVELGNTRYTWKIDSINPPRSVKLLPHKAE